MWVIFLKLINGQYEIMQGGYNIVPQKEYDKVLPTTEQIVKQIDKIYFDGENLKIKEGEILLTVSELNNLNNIEEININNENEKIYDIQ